MSRIALTDGRVRVSGGPSSGAANRRIYVELDTGDCRAGHDCADTKNRYYYLWSRTDVAKINLLK